MTRVALLDYGYGNLRSVAKALERVGGSVDIVSNLDGVAADGIVVPGQGAFGTCRAGLERSGSFEPLRAWIAAGRPYLGICLGLQILFDGSDESPSVPGFGIVPGRIVRLPSTVKVPHIGWNDVTVATASRGRGIFGAVEDGSYFYFDHSYVPARDAAPGWAAATTEYGATFTCAVARDAAAAVQFHPEKSGEAGLALLERFVKECVA